MDDLRRKADVKNQIQKSCVHVTVFGKTWGEREFRQAKLKPGGSVIPTPYVRRTLMVLAVMA